MSNKKKGKFGTARHPKHHVLKEIKLISRKIMKLELQYQFAKGDGRGVDAQRILKKAESLNTRLEHLKEVLNPLGDKPAEKKAEKKVEKKVEKEDGNPDDAI